MTNTRIYSKLMTEIDDALAAGKVPSGADDIVTESQARELPYVQACIKEGLLWYPPVTGELSKKTSPQGDAVCGYKIPGGVKVGFSVKSIHRDRKLFGPDEDGFRPERWLPVKDGGHEESAEKLKAMERNNDLVFGYGKYQVCLSLLPTRSGHTMGQSLLFRSTFLIDCIFAHALVILSIPASLWFAPSFKLTPS